MAVSIQVVFDCADPDAMAKFWAEALGYRIPPPPEGFSTWEEWLGAKGIPESDWNKASAIEDPEGLKPRVYFQKVPESKAVKNRVHLDLNVGGGRGVPMDERRRRVHAEAGRLVGLGAKEVRAFDEHDEYWVAMLDPEGNEFDLQ